MTAAANTFTWRAYRDGDRFIIGPSEWQGRAVSLTYGIAEVWSDDKALIAKCLRRARATPTERCEELKWAFDTYDRFEAACDRGDFGCAW